MLTKLYIYLIFIINLGRLLDFFPALAPLHIGKLTLGSALVFLAATQGGRLVRDLRENIFFPHICLLLAVALVGIPFSVWRGGALESFLGYLKTLAGFVIICSLCGSHGSQTVLTMRRAVTVTVGMLALMMVLAKSTGRLSTSATYDPNDIALLFVTFLPLVAMEAVTGKGLTRVLAAGTAVMAVMGVALTQSRGGIIALTALGLHAVLLSKRRWQLLPVLCVTVALVVGIADDALWDRFRSLHDESDYNLEARSGRLEIWKEGLSFFIHDPLTGVGIGQFASALGMIGSGVYMTAHNSYIQIASELGIVGIGAYLAMLWRVRKMALAASAAPLAHETDTESHNLRLLHTGLLLSLTGFAAGSFFLSQAYGGILYALLGITAVLARDHTRREADAPAPMQEPAPSSQADAAQSPLTSKVQGRSGEAAPAAPSLSGSLSLTRVAKADAVRAARELLLAQGNERSKERTANRGKGGAS